MVNDRQRSEYVFYLLPTTHQIWQHRPYRHHLLIPNGKEHALAERIKYCNYTNDSNYWAKTLLGMLMIMKKLKPYFRKRKLYWRMVKMCVNPSCLQSLEAWNGCSGNSICSWRRIGKADSVFVKTWWMIWFLVFFFSFINRACIHVLYLLLCCLWCSFSADPFPFAFINYDGDT